MLGPIVTAVLGPRAFLDLSVMREFEQLAALCEKHGVRAIYQLHHNTLMPSPSAVFPIVVQTSISAPAAAYSGRASETP